MKKIAILGASYQQLPLIRRAKELGFETHVFAWQCGDVGESEADFFHPISIIEKDAILLTCRKLNIDGICSIASDLAVITINHVAHALGLIGNSPECTANSTNKAAMRRCFRDHGDPIPKYASVCGETEALPEGFAYPVIIKPTDRSGSRGVVLASDDSEFREAVRGARAVSFEKEALVEEYIEGREFSVEYISYEGKHHFLAITEKFKAGASGFVECAHLEPAQVSERELTGIRHIVEHALDSLGVRFGASHSEIKLRDDGRIFIIEIGSRMGGDMIGSCLVPLSTGVDYVENVIRIAMGDKPKDITPKKNDASAIRFLFSKEDLDALTALEAEHPEYLTEKNIRMCDGSAVHDSSDRAGYFIMKASKAGDLIPYLPMNRS